MQVKPYTKWILCNAGDTIVGNTERNLRHTWPTYFSESTRKQTLESQRTIPPETGLLSLRTASHDITSLCILYYSRSRKVPKGWGYFLGADKKVQTS